MLDHTPWSTAHLPLDQLFIEYFAARESRRYELLPLICEWVSRHIAFDPAVRDLVEELRHPDPGGTGVPEQLHRLATLVARHVNA